MARYLILGRGYTGAALEKLLEGEGHEVTCSGRNRPGLLHFDLDDEASWPNLPDGFDGTFMTLPFKKPRQCRPVR